MELKDHVRVFIIKRLTAPPQEVVNYPPVSMLGGVVEEDESGRLVIRKIGDR